jgi:hypothetical protein
MQLADLIDYAMFRAYNTGDWGWANTLLPALTREGEHRRLHLTDEDSCSCGACTSSRGERGKAALV